MDVEDLEAQQESAVQSIAILGGTVEIPVDFILSQCYADPEDVVLIAGTLIEGIGNACSDVDVYVVRSDLLRTNDIDFARHHRVISKTREIMGPSSPDLPVYLIHTVVPGTEIKVDVEFLTFEEVNSVFERAASIFKYAARNPILLTQILSYREQDLIHRIFNGIFLMNEHKLLHSMGYISRSQYCYIEYRWFGSDFARLLDLIGTWRKGELDRSVDQAREYLINEMSAYLFLLGVTTPRRKWLLTYLERLDPIDPGMKADFLSLFFLYGVQDDVTKHDYVIRVLDLADRIFARAANQLEATPGIPSGAEGLRLLEANRDLGERSSYADLEFEYRAKAYGVPGRPTRLFLGRFGGG